MSTIYESGDYLAQNTTWHEEDSPKKTEWIVRILKRHNINPSFICEIGCGAGAILQNVSKEYPNAECLGTDISPQAIEIAKTKENEKLKFILGMEDTIKQTSDVLLCIDVFEHIEDYFSFLRKIKTKSKYHIFHIPLDLSVQAVSRENRLLKNRKDVGHIHYFNRETALAVLADCGYSIIDYNYTSACETPSCKSPKSVNLLRKLLFRLYPNLVARIIGGYSLLVLTK